MKEQIDIFDDLLIEFDEMGFVPTTAVPDHEAYAIDWKNRLINALEGYRKQVWISVDDRLPDKGQEVLAYRGDFNGDMMNTYTYLGSENWEDDYGYRGSTEHEGITHWMPLPEPPKGE